MSLKSKNGSDIKRKSRMPGGGKSNLELWLLCLPGIIKVLIFSYIPLLWMTLAFKFYVPRKGLFGSRWVEFQNFEVLFKSGQAWTLIKNAIGINVLCIGFGTVISVLLGLFMFETGKKFLKVTQILYVFPFFISWPLVGVLLKAFLSGRTGMISSLLSAVGVDVQFYKEPKLWKGIIAFSYIFKTAGMSAVTYYAVLMGADKELYEAARIDGAKTFGCMWHVSLPALKTMIILNVIMATTDILKVDFNMVYYLTDNKAALYSATDVIETYMFRATTSGSGLEQGTAIGLVQGVVGLTLTLIVNKLCNKLFGESLI